MKKNIKAAPAMTDKYFDLVKQFPLRAIRSEAECDLANQILKDLVERADNPGLSSGEREYADALSQLIGVYEDKHYPIDHIFKTPLARLKYLMEQQGMTSGDLGELLGSGKGQASLILNGKRELSKANIRTLAERFKVSAAAFL
jgi:HTH-type transcriptional regulator / antitoxin HigA